MPSHSDGCSRRPPLGHHGVSLTDDPEAPAPGSQAPKKLAVDFVENRTAQAMADEIASAVVCGYVGWARPNVVPQIRQLVERKRAAHHSLGHEA